MKTGRNDPCPCGSGKKYKQCCLDRDSAPAVESPQLSAQHKAHVYLRERFRTQQRDLIAGEFFGQFEESDGLQEALGDLDEGHRQMLAVALDDWLLCEAEYERRHAWKRGIDWVLTEAKARLSKAELAILEGMALAPLHLYEISAIERGKGFCLRDLHDAQAQARFVHEDSGTRNVREGDVVGLRVIEDPDRRLRISGAVYTFSRIEALDILREIDFALIPVENVPQLPPAAEEVDGLIADHIRESWLDGLLHTPRPPDLVTPDGEPVLMIEDEYELLDQAALEAALEAQEDVDGDVEEGWIRFLVAVKGAEEMGSPLSSIYLGDEPGTVVLLHRNASGAELGREWFDRVAGSVVRHRESRTIDPMEMFASDEDSELAIGVERPQGMTPEEHSAAIAQAIASIHSNWCDAPLSALNFASPREMLATPEGRERVRFVLRTFELAERDMAAQQKRPEVSFDFLWRELGLGRDEPAV